MKLNIKNFQSIENCEIDIPEKSFTCLVGPTNIGKSAIRRALECVLYNKSEISYIRNGSTSCEVTLTLKDGTIIEWSRDKKTSSYKINGESFSKLGGSVPEIISNNGFREITVSKEKLNVQVAHQFENIFLLNKTGSYITEVLSNLGNLNRIIEANKYCQNDKKNIKSKIKVREEDLSKEKDKILLFNGIDKNKKIVEEFKKKLEDLKRIKFNREELLKINKKIDKSKNILNNLSPLKKVKEIECDIPIERYLEIVKICEKYYKVLNKKNNYHNIPDDIDDFSEIQKNFDRYIQIKKSYNILSSKTKKIQDYKKIPKEPNEINIDIEKIKEIKKLQEKLINSKFNILNYREELKKEEINLKSYELEYKEVKEELKVCPLCDSRLV